MQIGTATLLKTTTFHDASFETAAWWQDVKCEPQTVPIHGQEQGTPGAIYYLTPGWSFEGEIVDAYFPSLWGGVPIGSGDPTGGKIGLRASRHFHPYDYILCEVLLDRGGMFGDHVKVELTPPRTIATTQFWHTEVGLKDHHKIVDPARWNPETTLDEQIERTIKLAEHYAERYRKLDYRGRYHTDEGNELRARCSGFESAIGAMLALKPPVIRSSVSVGGVA